MNNEANDEYSSTTDVEGIPRMTIADAVDAYNTVNVHEYTHEQWERLGYVFRRYGDMVRALDCFEWSDELKGL